MVIQDIYFDFKESIKKIYYDCFGIDYTNENFFIPEVFLKSIDQLNISELYDYSSIITLTASGVNLYQEDFLERKRLNKLRLGDKMFICIGGWSDRHEFLMCCDKSSKDIGKIFDFNDAHPWAEDESEVEWSDFSFFLEDEYNTKLY